MAKRVNKQCRECGGKCCQYFCFQIDEPESFEEFEDLRWFLLHEGISIHVDEGDWYISIANRCSQFKDGRCAIYETRPLICRKYSHDGCDFTGGEYDYDHLFEAPEQIRQYAVETLGRKAYDKARDKAYAKAEKKAKGGKSKKKRK